MFREEHKIGTGASWLGAGWGKIGHVGSGQVGERWWADWAGWLRSIRAGGASGQVEQFVGKLDSLRAGCGRNIGVDWADSRFDREKWLAPLRGREGAMAAERVGGHLNWGTLGGGTR
jgi:hypothetical protein